MRFSFSVLCFVFVFSCAPVATVDADVSQSDPDAGVPLVPGFFPLDADGVERWGAVADGTDEVAYIFGGTNQTDFGGEIFNTFQRFDPFSGEVESLTLSNPPSPRYCGCSAYNPSTQEFLIVGGRDRSAVFDSLFLVDTRTLETRELAVTIDRALGCSAAYVDGKAYLFGGANADGFSQRTFVFDFADESLVEVQSEQNPSARYDASMILVGDSLFLAGGTSSPPSIEAYARDLWRFDLSSLQWSLQADEFLSGRRTPLMLADGDDAFYIGFGASGEGPRAVHGDLHRYDIEQAQLEEKNFDEMPSARGFNLALPGRGSDIGYLLGGTDYESVFSDVWVLR